MNFLRHLRETYHKQVILVFYLVHSTENILYRWIKLSTFIPCMLSIEKLLNNGVITIEP